MTSAEEAAGAARNPAEPRPRRSLLDRTAQAAGLLAIALALAFAGALLSHHPDDPSRLVQGGGPFRNWLGALGARISADALDFLGPLAAWAAAGAALGWGWRLFRRMRIGSFWLRPLTLLLALAALAHAQALLSPGPGSGLAGIASLSVGLLREALGPGVGDAPWAGHALAAAFSLAALLAWLHAAAVPLAGARAAGRGALRLLAAPFRRRGADGAGQERAEPTIGPAPRRRRALRRGKRAPERPKEVVRADPPRAGRREAKERQRELGLSGLGFQLPPLELLKAPARPARASDDGREANARMLESVLHEFRISGEVVRAVSGPVVTRYEFEPAAGTRSSRVIALSGDIARSMSAMAARVAVVPGRNAIGIELPNARRDTVYLRELLGSEGFEKADAPLPVALGKDIAGEPVIADLARMPHLLIAGTTGSGKSVGVNAMVLSLLYRMTPEEVRLVMIDPKMLELSVYEGIPHLLHPVVTDPKKAVAALRWAIREMNSRYQTMSLLGVRGIDAYNRKAEQSLRKKARLSRTVQTGFDAETGKPVYEEQEVEARPFPYIVIVVDEMADLMLSAGKEFELAIQALAQKARAAGIHMIVATQRPSVDVVTGTIKANLPCRISFQVSSAIDSRTVLGDPGAEQLLGKGDMLFMQTGGRAMRAHGPFVGDDEVEKVANFLREQGEPEYVEEVTQETDEEIGGEAGSDGRDPLFADAVSIVAREGKASTSFLQRHLQIGYNRAARIIDRMEADGIVSAANHAGKREVTLDGGGGG